MKNFFKNLFGKKYPDRVGRNNRISGVYAGPDEMNNMKKTGRMIERVYAGPPRPSSRREEETPIEDVYMGPEPFEPDEPEDTAADLLVPFFDIALNHHTFYHGMEIRVVLARVEHLLDDADLFLILLVRIGMVGVHDAGGVYDLALVVEAL